MGRLLLLSFLFAFLITGCGTTNEKRVTFDNYYHPDGRFERSPNSVWEALKAFWSSYDSTPPSLSGRDFEQLALGRGDVGTETTYDTGLFESGFDKLLQNLRPVVRVPSYVPSYRPFES